MRISVNLFLGIRKHVAWGLLFQFFLISAQAQLKPGNLRIENLRDTIGLGETKPRFSWQITSDKRNALQTAYELRVTADPNADQVIWNSGRVASDSSIHVSYKGPSLQSRQKYYWQVKAWDKDGKASAWSPVGSFQMALLKNEDWKASWISTFQDPGMTSFNHYAYGAVGDWMYRTITGIDYEGDAVAYKRIKIKLQPGGDLTFAKARYESYFGPIVSHWKMEGSTFILNVEIPPNTRASLYVQGDDESNITTGGKQVSTASVVSVRREPGYTVLEVGSGSYQFESKVLPK
jgi:hypothetical protein